jgi:glycosyltransferase involved in cell wall biosynthesis
VRVQVAVSGTIAVIVVSFERPRMLREALASIEGADQVVVADDGSESFNPVALAREFHLPAVRFVLNPPKLPQQRMTLLCDDDLFAPGWVQAAAGYLDQHPLSHMVRGDWHAFNDGEPLSKAKPCTFDLEPPVTTGNFAYRASCAIEEGCEWSEMTVSCHDAAFLDGYFRRHKSRDIAHVGVLAGYRREHPKNMLKFLDGNGYQPEVAEFFSARSLE